MDKVKDLLFKLLGGERGQDMVEYALITVTIAAAIVLATAGLLSPAFEAWANGLADCVSGAGPCSLA